MVCVQQRVIGDRKTCLSRDQITSCVHIVKAYLSECFRPCPYGGVVWLPSEYAPDKTSPEKFRKHIYRENLAAAIAASECGTAKLGHMMMLMNDDLWLVHLMA